MQVRGTLTHTHTNTNRHTPHQQTHTAPAHTHTTLPRLTFPCSITTQGGLVQFVIPFEWARRADTLFYVLWMVLFFLAFGVFLLNVFLAIIVDTFGGA